MKAQHSRQSNSVELLYF
uniref:Uncharacterized protein n=1 Tax=Anguilla anguilla TaxID=7936 RepID=A0A0E9TX03_ANGAN